MHGVSETVSNVGQRAWLALVSSRDRRGTERYDDDPASHYSWDSTVPNRDAIRVGDALVLWDSNNLLGASVIDRIDTGASTKLVARCPECARSNVERRKKLTPPYRCYDCKEEFDAPKTNSQEVRTYRTDHAAGWVDLVGALSGAELRQLCVKPRSQLSIRPLDWERFVGAVRTSCPDLPLTAATAVADRIRHGHTEATVRVRIGQSDFRRHLLAKYGNVCAFSGPSPSAALEAAHLYSYAAEGKHHDDGGFLLRRDLHRLFDLGLIARAPSSGRLELTEELHKYPDYLPLQGSELHIPVSPVHQRFLDRHWRQHRDTPTP